MASDITKLAQKRNAAISRLSRAFEPGHSSQTELDALSFAVDVMNDLVEALEKAQATEAHCNRGWREAHEQEARAEAAEKRIAELESRTVTVKLPDDEDGQAYGFGKWANGKLPATTGTMTISYCEDAWRAAFEVFSSAAGIKWEAE